MVFWFRLLYTDLTWGRGFQDYTNVLWSGKTRGCSHYEVGIPAVIECGRVHSSLPEAGDEKGWTGLLFEIALLKITTPWDTTGGEGTIDTRTYDLSFETWGAMLTSTMTDIE